LWNAGFLKLLTLRFINFVVLGASSGGMEAKKDCYNSILFQGQFYLERRYHQTGYRFRTSPVFYR
jgi:hypothetical protein